MIDCPRCGGLVPEVFGAPSQICPHCSARIVPRILPTVGALVLAAARALRQNALLYWGIFLPAAVIANGAPWFLAALDPAHRAALVGCALCGTTDPVAIAELLFAELIGFFAFFVAWAVTAALLVEGDARSIRTGRFWARAMLCAMAMGALFLLVPITLLFAVWFLFTPLLIGSGRSVKGAFAESYRMKIRPAGFSFTVVTTGVVSLLIVNAAALLPTGPAVSALVVGIVWWLLAPLVPALVNGAWPLLAGEGQTSP
ncbi:MAG: hypothetical protein ACYDDF_10260 [Thermoplasmatota archaeon]